ncbi:MAG: class I SAM-dependent methyltransferase [Deltaproteobacteria bacterium]|nr:class I SAM-dependent methyltransferase [Deltaproteobacteria bacterium]
MKLNWGERLAVNNPLRVVQQGFEVRWFKQRARVPEGLRVLEIGCGRGAGAELLLREFRPRELHATDLDLEMLRRAEVYMDPAALARATLTVADAVRLPHRDEAFDVVFGFGVLHHIPDWRGALREVARVLKPGGLYCLEELYPSLYQNALTKHFLLHPTEDRFHGTDLRGELPRTGLRLRDTFEVPRIGLLAVCERPR